MLLEPAEMHMPQGDTFLTESKQPVIDISVPEKDPEQKDFGVSTISK